ncbi:hypothetical protein AVEN_268902-1 [Araneus ventricosus]|uniref:Uncharacterized protein n=1 Tax=Araneus ventricosus TaxID=182803 RepID=A0A4Y2PDT0_ARAVE|nr:hypothetical protein AVEN_268902-1 [Araneus ventricosus]
MEVRSYLFYGAAFLSSRSQRKEIYRYGICGEVVVIILLVLAYLTNFMNQGIYDRGICESFCWSKGLGTPRYHLRKKFNSSSNIWEGELIVFLENSRKKLPIFVFRLKKIRKCP